MRIYLFILSFCLGIFNGCSLNNLVSYNDNAIEFNVENNHFLDKFNNKINLILRDLTDESDNIESDTEENVEEVIEQEVLKEENVENNSNKTLFEQYNKIVFIGDSRTVGLSNSINNDLNIKFICEVSKGYYWLKEQNISQYIDDNTLVLINLGVNDLGNKDQYVKYLKSLNIKNLYYISVYPVNETIEEIYGYSVRNESIKNFNKTMSENFNYIDVYSYLMDNGFETSDGIHYRNNTYANIYNFLKSYKN